jgi:hypothetical protein
MAADDQDFYSQLTEKLRHSWTTVDIYSISACFGFYSRGMRTFAEVLGAMRTALTNPDPFRTKRMRLLLTADENRIDLFGVERFHQYLEPVGLEIRRLEKPEDRGSWVQFALFDGKEALHTRPQSGIHDEALDLGINKLEPAQLADSQRDAAKLHSLQDLFTTAWEASKFYDFPRIPTVGMLEEIFTSRFPIHRSADMDEKGYEDQLYILLHGVCDPKLIHRQFRIGADTFDLVLGNPKIRLLAIELKLATDDEGVLKRLKGQILSYRALVRDVMVLLVGPGISPRKLGDLEHEFRNDTHVRILHVK